MHKLESVLSILMANFRTSKFRELAGVVKFNTDILDDVQLIELANLSIHLACDVRVKRSGTGLLIIIAL